MEDIEAIIFEDAEMDEMEEEFAFTYGRSLPKKVHAAEFCGLSLCRKRLAKNRERYEEYRQWLGVEDLDLISFDLAECNKKIRS